MKKSLLLAVGVLVCTISHAQEVPIDDNQREAAFDQIIELVSENLESENLDFTTLLEDLNYFYDHPINLNNASREELRRLGLLNELQIEGIIRHRESSGRFISELELQGVEMLDMETIRAIAPFVKVSGSYDDKQITWTGIKEEGSHEAFIRYQRVLEPMDGYAPISEQELAERPNARYVGSPERVFARYRFRYLRNISVGLTVEKDAGEEFFGSTQPRGFDYYSGHIYIGERHILKRAIIGDYQAQFGQGLVFWSGLAFGKSADVSSIKRNARGITPYVSADENNFMRGAATTLALGPLEVTTFFSYKGVDANITSVDSNAFTGTSVVSEFSSFQLSGVHGTPGQLEDKDAVMELNTGGHIRYKREAMSVGVTGVYTSYNADINASPQLYRSLEPVDRQFLMTGFDYQGVFKNIMVFGENSLRSNGGAAFLNGAIMSLDEHVDISLLHRNYDPMFSSPRTNAIGESSRNTNESGLYLGTALKFNRSWKLTGYYDLFRFDWLRFRTDAPSDGQELLAQLEYRPNRRFKVYGRYRFEDKWENNNFIESPTTVLGQLRREWYRIHVQYDLSKTLSLRNRLEYTRANLSDGEEENGWLIYQDLVWKPQWPAKYQLKLRYALFDTDSYQSRIYAYENDVLYSFSIPAYFYRGSRFYVIFGYDITRWSDLTVRFAQTYFSNRDEVGSGLNRVDGSTRSEIKVQYRVKF